MAEQTPTNILLNPIPELTIALETNKWGINPSSSEVLTAECFPVTPEDLADVRQEVRSRGGSGRVVGRARVGLLEGGEVFVLLDQRGFTIENARDTTTTTYPSSTYETLEALLIAVSPLYVEAMTREVAKRFEGFTRGDDDEDEAGDPDSTSDGAEVRDVEKAAEDGSSVWR